MFDPRGSFECVGGFFVPCLTTDPDGAPRCPDGVRYFGFRDVAVRTGIDEASIQEAYAAFLREVGAGIQGETQSASSRETLRQRFHHLSDQHFAEYLEVCRSKRFSPWGKHMWADVKAGPSGLPELVVQMTADGIHAVALRTGEVEKIIGPEWCGTDRAWHSVWTGSEPPFAARVGVVRRGMTEPLYMVARWDSYAPFQLVAGQRRYDGFWRKMPDFMLGKCAACAAIRRAFAEFLDGIYSPEEMAQSRNVSAPMAIGDEDPDAPQTNQQFQLKLIDLGLGKPSIRAEAVERLRAELPMLYGSNMPAFYAAALKRVAAEPEKYAGMAPAAT